MKALTLSRSVYSLLGICFISYFILILTADISVFYTVATYFFMFSFICLLGIGAYAVFRNKIARERFIRWAVIAIGVSILLSIVFDGSSGGGCSETYAGYDTGWSDVCMDDYRG